MDHPNRALAVCTALAALLVAGPAAGCRARSGPLNERPPNASGQRPAFPGQTRAPEQKLGVKFTLEPFAEALNHPWGMVFLPDGRLLVSERPGRLRLIAPDGALSAPLAGLPPVDARGQGGLLGLALDPGFVRNQLLYWSYSERRPDGANNTAVARGKLVLDGTPRLENVETIFHQTPSLNSTLHFGSRLVFGRDGLLYVTMGDRSIPEGRRQAQRLDGLLGKVVRLRPDGSIPPDNPFAGRPDARPEIWSYGHRNIQGAALHPETGELWTVEHGTRGGDELNITRPGRDYGWPTIAYGIEYGGGAITGDITAREGMEQPVYYWDPVIAPGGMAFYTGSLFPAWRHSLFIAGLGSTHLVRLTLDGERVTGEERLLAELGERLRDVIVGPEGALYLATDSNRGRILRLVPAP